MYLGTSKSRVKVKRAYPPWRKVNKAYPSWRTSVARRRNRTTNSSKVFLVGYPAQLILIASITPWRNRVLTSYSRKKKKNNDWIMTKALHVFFYFFSYIFKIILLILNLPLHNIFKSHLSTSVKNLLTWTKLPPVESGWCKWWPELRSHNRKIDSLTNFLEKSGILNKRKGTGWQKWWLEWAAAKVVAEMGGGMAMAKIRLLFGQWHILKF